jgi:hypothetical protein
MIVLHLLEYTVAVVPYLIGHGKSYQRLLMPSSKVVSNTAMQKNTKTGL